MDSRWLDMRQARRYDLMCQEETMMQANETSTVDLKLTEKAVEQVKTLLARNKLIDHALRISVSDGGCSGFSYQLNFEKEQKSGDITLNLQGLTVYVDPSSVPFLQGTIIDFASGLYGGGFKFTNPNATGTCGCGTSFSA
jgi:iron-sulfur cluster assembly protein